jgi:putative PIG3 family NAD(P)H quinone oxidoreductase
MRAVVITGPGEAEVLAIKDVPDPPPPGGDQVLVRVRAAGLNRADIFQRRGQYPAPPGVAMDIPGLEFAGDIEAVGPAVQRWKPGRRVMGIVGGAAQADYVVVPEGSLAEVPDLLDWAEAAALPEVFITAHDALFTQAGLELGETVLIHSAASGVGTAAVQLAHAAGCLTFGTSRTPDKLEKVRLLGLDEPIALTGEQPGQVFATRILEATGSQGVNVIMDLIGAPYLGANLRALAQLGRMICVGVTAGAAAEMDMHVLLRKRLRIMGTNLRYRTTGEKAAAVRRFNDQVMPLVRCGILRPVIDSAYELSEVVEAHKRLEANATFGKVVLTF